MQMWISNFYVLVEVIQVYQRQFDQNDKIHAGHEIVVTTLFVWVNVNSLVDRSDSAVISSCSAMSLMLLPNTLKCMVVSSQAD